VLVLTAKWAFMAIAVAMLVWALASNWGEVSAALAQIGWAPLALASVAACVALGFNTLSWRAVMRAVGLNAPLRGAAAVFLISQPGKYVPGAVWPVLAQAEFAKEHQVSRAKALTGSIVAMVVGVAMAGIVGAVGLTVAAPGSLVDYWWALAVAVGLVVLITPPVLHRVVALALKVTRRGHEAVAIDGRSLALCAAWSLLNWLALGVHAWILLTPLATDSPTFALAAGSFALSWLVGFLVVVAPAGLGAREAALVVMLAGVATAPQALAVALLSRFAMTIADAVGLAVGVALRPLRRSR
jgi:uncharacterized membrane protein YbhN (UPF0104 family)